MAIPPLVVLEDIGLFPGAAQWVALAVDQLKYRRDRLVQPGSTAEEVARRIGRTIPVIHGAQAVGAAASLRWKNQVNENAKSPAFAGTYPELCHNDIAGWGQHGDVTRQVLSLCNLRHDTEHPQVVRRFAFVADLLQEVVSDVIEVRAQGEGDLAQLLDLMLIGDFVSLHLAAREGIDPGPVPILEEFKRRLGEAWTVDRPITRGAHMPTPATDHDVADLALAELGRQRIAWADANMPVPRLHPRALRQGAAARRLIAAACLHVTTETANLLRTLRPAAPRSSSAPRTRCRRRTTWPPRSW